MLAMSKRSPRGKASMLDARAHIIYIDGKTSPPPLPKPSALIFLSIFLQVRGESPIFGAWFGKPLRPRTSI